MRYAGGVTLLLVILLLFPSEGFSKEMAPISEATQSCLECHESLHPGIVAAWRQSLHARRSPAQALRQPRLERRISTAKLPEHLMGTVVGCAECHTLSPQLHGDTFEHNDFKVHVVVTPKDCSVCHPVEAGQYQKNLMSHAYGILMNNPLYMDLVKHIVGLHEFKTQKLSVGKPEDETMADSCLYCHGTKVEVKGLKERETELGEMSFPILTGWPNHGVGRINPDGTMGACSPCHSRHSFSIEMARKPQTCAECHKGPDVPAYPVYKVSKHGNLFASLGHSWNFSSVPWTVGKDFMAPTCAACHVSLIVKPDGEVVAERTHQMNDRASWRLMAVPYAHSHPRSPDTWTVKNEAGLPLLVELDGRPVSGALIGVEEQRKRRNKMKGVCLSCHSSSWVEGHFRRFEHAIDYSNKMTLAATEILLSAWKSGVAKGLEHNESIFDEVIEIKWVEQWLFYANSTRFASAMAGTDYGVFANGRYKLATNLQEMLELLHTRQR